MKRDLDDPDRTVTIREILEVCEECGYDAALEMALSADHVVIQ